MLPPQVPGFTGVDWHSRTTERLATDLLGGAGARPLTTAAQETARLASAYGTAAVALDRLLVRLDGAIEVGAVADVRVGRERSAAAPAGRERRSTGPLPEYARWLARHAADLAEYAAKLAGQAAAYETAARAMPSVADAQRLEADRESTRAAAAAGGAEPAAAALAGAAAESERVEQQTHGTAAQVMVGFERAAEPLRAPWELAPAPKLETTDKARGKETAAGGTGRGASGGGAGMPATPLGGYAASTPQRDQATTSNRPVASTSSANTGRAFPMMPAGMMGAGAGLGNRGATHQSGAVPSSGPEEIPDAFVVHTAPAVFGGEELEEAL